MHLTVRQNLRRHQVLGEWRAVTAVLATKHAKVRARGPVACRVPGPQVRAQARQAPP